MVGAGAHDGPSQIDKNMLSDPCFFGASKAPPPTDRFFKPTDKPKFEIYTFPTPTVTRRSPAAIPKAFST